MDESVSWLTDIPAREMQRIVDALYRVHHLISVITDLDTLLERIMEESKHVAQAEACSLILYDPVTEELYFQVALGETGDQQALKREVRLKLNQGIAGVAAVTRESVNVPDVRRDTRFYRLADETSRFETRSLLAVPLVDRDKLVGVLEVLNKTDGGPFSEMDMRVLEMFSTVVATVIVNARLIEENLRAERLSAIGEAVAGLSHYTKNIITGMSGSVDLIDQGLEVDNLEFLKKSWPIFKRSTKRIAHFVEDMLAFSKPRRPVIESCDLRMLIDEVAQTFWGLLIRRNLTLEVNTDGVTGPVLVDSRGLFRCLLNLLTNAADAVSQPSGYIRVAACFTSDRSLQLEVSDNGPGVLEVNFNKIFEPFFSTKGSQGTGLGLAVTRKIVKEHGGKIDVGRSPEGGALFRITLPQLETTN
ncbi:MAG: GAF domain-containing protein [Candidatus Hydrogenedentes bacterium]|nr:GAF domain-containing protein [Candidatus Hydrogenedentota bacterium]